MSSFVKGLLAGVLLVFACFALIGLVAVVASSGKPDVPADAALVVTLQGDVPEHVANEMPPFLRFGDDSEPITLFRLAEAIRQAGDDERVKALVLRCKGSGAGWAKAQELRWAIQAYKESGKPVLAFLETAGREDYYIASLADRVSIEPQSFLQLSGLSAEVMFFKGTLDKLGVQADLIRTGKYKTAGEPYSREEMSPEWRAVLNDALDEFYGQLLAGLAEARGEDAEHWRAVIDEGPFDTDSAVEHGLVDDVLDAKEFFDAVEEEIGEGDLNRISAAEYARRALPAGSSGRRIAVMHAVGAIVRGSSWTDPWSGRQQSLGSDTFNSQLDRLRDDDRVEGVILRIDSPGGDAIASEQMLRAVRRLRAEKPVVVSMSNVAASGGYYIASAPDVPIVAYPGTYTGSIGVFTIHLNFRDLYDKIGITKEVLTRGRHAGMFTDYRPLDEAEREKIRGYVDNVYETFLARVSEGRGVDTDEVRDLAEGRVWIGSQAEENGLVDELGGMRRAIELVREAAGIEEGESVSVVTYPPRRSMLEMLFSQGRDAALARLLDAPGLGETRRAWSEALAWAERLRGGGAMYMSPYTLTVN